MPLDEFTIMSAAPREKPFKLLDRPWLYLVVNPSGAKRWYLKYQFAGKGQTVCLGSYPTVPLSAAREKRNEALLAIREGRNLAHEWKAAQIWQALEIRNSFKFIALDFLAQMESQWSAQRRENSIRWLEAHIYPAIGERPLSQIEPGEVLAEIHKIGDHKTAVSVRALCIQVFRHGVSCDACSRDTVSALRGAAVRLQPRSCGAKLS